MVGRLSLEIPGPQHRLPAALACGEAVRSNPRAQSVPVAAAGGATRKHALPSRANLSDRHWLLSPNEIRGELAA